MLVDNVTAENAEQADSCAAIGAFGELGFWSCIANAITARSGESNL